VRPVDTMGAMSIEPGEPRRRLERPPGERYERPPAESDGERIAWPPVAVGIGAAIAYTLLGGVLGVTAGLVVVAAFVGWLLGRLVSPPTRAVVAALVTIAAGLLGIWLFGRIEGGVLDPIGYLDDVQGWPLVVLQFAVAAAVAAASSRGPRTGTIG
jgi:hypothetical protein